ncbi:hypothetical protein Bbelb_281570 [Branchiostoma belcheri]|nr:hypothetical protein Bbelb_281570 [Branchiostoma belcheri]
MSELSCQKRSRTLTTDASVEEAGDRVSDLRVRKAYSHADRRCEQTPLARSMPPRRHVPVLDALGTIDLGRRSEGAATPVKDHFLKATETHPRAALGCQIQPARQAGSPLSVPVGKPRGGRPVETAVQQTTMRTPTLFVAIILAMAMGVRCNKSIGAAAPRACEAAGDSADIERLLRHLRLLAGEETIDEASMTHTKGKTVDTEETQLLELVKKLSLESEKPKPNDTLTEYQGEWYGVKIKLRHSVSEITWYVGPCECTKQLWTPGVSEVTVTSRNFRQLRTTSDTCHPTPQVSEVTTTSDTCHPTPQVSEVTVRSRNFRQLRTTSDTCHPTPQVSEVTVTSRNFRQLQTPATLPHKCAEEEGSTDVEQNYDVAETGEKDPASTEVSGEQPPDVGQNYGMTGPGDQDPTAKGIQTKAASSSDGHIENKKAVSAFLAAAAKEIGGKVVDKLGDRIADGVVENHQEKVVSGLQDYLGKQMDKFDDEYKELLKDTSGLAAGLNRPVEEADIQLVPRPGATMGNMYAPPGWEIRHKYKYKEDRNEKVSFGGQATAYTYPAGLGPVLMNGCFGTGYKNGDPCFKAKIPRTGCPNLIDGATYLGVGFDGRGVYSAESRKKSVIQRSCKNLRTYGKNEVPDSMTVQGIYDTDVESYTFSSTEEYRNYLAEKSAVTSAKAMFQEEINKASGHGAVGGLFGLLWSAGGGRSSQSGTSRQSSDFSASSSASARLSEKQTQIFMAMLEINIFR